MNALMSAREASAEDDVLVLRFEQPGTFQASNAAEAWCREHGVSFGPSDRTGVRALLVGDVVIAKWHNLTPAERNDVDGTITGNGREGPLTLRIFRDALTGTSGREVAP